RRQRDLVRRNGSQHTVEDAIVGSGTSQCCGQRVRVDDKCAGAGDKSAKRCEFIRIEDRFDSVVLELNGKGLAVLAGLARFPECEGIRAFDGTTSPAIHFEFRLEDRGRVVNGDTSTATTAATTGDGTRIRTAECIAASSAAGFECGTRGIDNIAR